MQFLQDFNKVDEGWIEEVQQINLSFSDNLNPDNSNIDMESRGDGYTFTIYTEANDQTPSELMDNLKFILAQN